MPPTTLNSEEPVNRQSPQKQKERKQLRNMLGSLLRFCRQLIIRKLELDMLEPHR